MRKLLKQDVLDMLKGSTVLGAGGGGLIDEGMMYLSQAEALGKEFLLADVNEVLDDTVIATPYSLGSLVDDESNGFTEAEAVPILNAVEKIEEYVGSKIEGIIACEPGGSNTAIPLYVAAMKNGFLLDADISGRAVPEVTNTTYYINNIRAYPIVTTNEYGELSIFENVRDDERAEEILRSMSSISNNNIAVVDHVMPFKEFKHAIIPGTMSKAIKLGKVLRESREKDLNAAEEVAKSDGGKVIFKGEISDFEWGNIDGFTEGNVIIKGRDDYEDNELRIWTKNENLITWLNGEVYVTLPDIITMFDDEVNDVVVNPEFKIGQKVSIIVLDAPSEFKTVEGLRAFGPKRFGFDIDYKPAINNK